MQWMERQLKHRIVFNLEKNKFKWCWSKQPMVKEVVCPNQIISTKKIIIFHCLD